MGRDAVLAAASLLVMAAPTSAATLQDGIEAYCAKRLADAFRILEPLAQKGDPDGQLIMGFRFRHGMDGKQDLSLARKWFREAADQGDPEAQVELGLMLAQGQGGSGSVQETRQTEVPLSRRPGETDPLPTRRQG